MLQIIAMAAVSTFALFFAVFVYAHVYGPYAKRKAVELRIEQFK
ncbi:hypothetical protein [Hymenobacter properus]|nr:hypothetical protein [Hymenobacter properus]